jgi:hypothetical protein
VVDRRRCREKVADEVAPARIILGVAEPDDMIL